MIRATNAKEVGMENPAEETFRRPNRRKRVQRSISSQAGNRMTFQKLNV